MYYIIVFQLHLMYSAILLDNLCGGLKRGQETFG